MTTTSYLAKFGLPAGTPGTIDPYEPGTCGKIVCQDAATVTLADNSRAMRYCDAHAENVCRGNDHWFPFYSTRLRAEQ